MYRARIKISVSIKEVDRNKKRGSIQAIQFTCFILCFWLRLTVYVHESWLHIQINWLVPSRIGRTYIFFNFLVLTPLHSFTSYLSHTLVALPFLLSSHMWIVQWLIMPDNDKNNWILVIDDIMLNFWIICERQRTKLDFNDE